MVDHAATLERLATTFTTRDIMIPLDQLVSAANTDEAQQLLEVYTDFDVVSVRSGDELVSYLKRDDRNLKPIERDEIISESTSILNLVDHLQLKPFYFVLVERRVAGYIHFSDLNNHLVKLPFYLLLNAVEEFLVESIRAYVTENIVREILGNETADKLAIELDVQRNSDSNFYLADMLYLPQIIKIAEHVGKLRLGKREKQSLILVRNKISHPTRPLVRTKRDLSRLATAHQTCTMILNQVKIINCNEAIT